MEKINATKLAVFSVLLLGTIAVAASGIQTNAFAYNSGPYFYHEGLESSFTNTDDTRKDVNEVIKELRATIDELSKTAQSSSVDENLDACPIDICF